MPGITPTFANDLYLPGAVTLQATDNKK